MPKEQGTASTDELATLAAVPRRVEVYTIDKETDAKIVKKLRIAPMTLDICGDAAVHLRGIVEKLGPRISAGMAPQIIADHKNAARAIIALATEEDETYIGSLPLDQAVRLLTDVWEVNHDFFVLRVGPLLSALADKMFVGVGPTPSDTSPSMDTQTP